MKNFFLLWVLLRVVKSSTEGASYNYDQMGLDWPI